MRFCRKSAADIIGIQRLTHNSFTTTMATRRKVDNSTISLNDASQTPTVLTYSHERKKWETDTKKVDYTKGIN